MQPHRWAACYTNTAEHGIFAVVHDAEEHMTYSTNMQRPAEATIRLFAHSQKLSKFRAIQNNWDVSGFVLSQADGVSIQLQLILHVQPSPLNLWRQEVTRAWKKLIQDCDAQRVPSVIDAYLLELRHRQAIGTRSTTGTITAFNGVTERKQDFDWVIDWRLTYVN